jgi:hypothetical protein
MVALTGLVPRLRRSDNPCNRYPSPSGLGLRLAVGPPGLRSDPPVATGNQGQRNEEIRGSYVQVLAQTLQALSYAVLFQQRIYPLVDPETHS